MLPADTHVHSEWSWDTGGPSSAAQETMDRTCERAVRIGLPAVVFTEHLDFGSWRAESDDFPAAVRHLHTLVLGDDRAEPITLYRLWPPDQVLWAYLEEVPRMVAGSDAFEVFTHLDDAVRWWREEGGRAVSFGSDAHVPDALADGFGEAVAMLEHFGFRPGDRPEAFWTR